MFSIELIGICGNILDVRQQQLLDSCTSVVASKRHQQCFFPDKKCIAIAPVQQMINEVQGALEYGNVAILASGDPLFFGIGKTLLTYFPPERVNIHPAVSAMQLACARWKMPWDDLSIVSLHGRSAQHLAAQVLTRDRVMLFTDHKNSPDQVARTLLNHLEEYNDRERLAAIQIKVAENLGLEDERLTEGTLVQIAAMQFSPLNMMMLKQPTSSLTLPAFGLQEDEIHHSRGLITKDEVRAATLHKLRLPNQGVFWDVGGGSGSISIEAARMHPELQVYTTEKKPEEQANIQKNIRSYGTYNVELVRGEAPLPLSELPAPDRVFIGGSGSHLKEIIELAAKRLQPSGRIVVNAVLAQTAQAAPELLHRQKLKVETVTLQFSRTTYPENETRQFNPITIITGSR